MPFQSEDVKFSVHQRHKSHTDDILVLTIKLLFQMLLFLKLTPWKTSKMLTDFLPDYYCQELLGQALMAWLFTYKSCHGDKS